MNEKATAVTGGVSLQSRVLGEFHRLNSESRGNSLTVLGSAQQAACSIDGDQVVNLASNNYLGFANHPALKSRAHTYLEEWGVGSGAVRGIGGTLEIHKELEGRLAHFKGVAATTLFTSGFTANQGVLGALLREGDLVISDELNHASIIDGLRLTKAKREVFAHADPEDLDRVLTQHDCDGLRLVVTDGVFSMDGDVAPLDRIVAVARKHNAVTYVDDAHGSGVMGPGGRGTVHHFGLQNAPDVIQIGTLSKAWGAIGGYAAGSHALCKLLESTARPFLYSTSLPPAMIGAVMAALDLVEHDSEIMDRMWDNAKYFKRELQVMGFDTMGSMTPITPILFGEAFQAQEASQMLRKLDVFAVAISYPVVPHGRARIRNIVTSDHTRDQLDQALGAYRKIGHALGVI